MIKTRELKMSDVKMTDIKLPPDHEPYNLMMIDTIT